jgi:hypothetical protein
MAAQVIYPVASGVLVMTIAARTVFIASAWLPEISS